MALVLNIKESVFLPCYQPYIYDYSCRYNVFYGGRGSGKTRFVIAKLLLKGLQERRMVLLMRKTTVNCKWSVWKELKEAIARFGLSQYFELRESDYSATCKINGTQFKCTGLDQAEKIKGFSEVSDCLLEEATEFTLEDYELIDGTIRSILYKLPLQIYFLFNPVSKANWVYKKFGFDTNLAPPQTFILKTTYLNNPYLSPDYIKRMEDMRVNNPNRWKIEALGDFVSLDRLIYTNWRAEEFDYKTIKGELYCGLDFGFTNDLTAFTAAIADEKNKRLYVFKEWGATGKTNKEIASVISALGFSKSVIIADSSEPKSIEELRREGIRRIRACTKGKDSVLHGIQALQNYEIIIHPSCEGLITEMENYAWSKNKEGEYINKPLENGFDHFCDSLRYSLQCAAAKVQILDKNMF